MAYYRFTRLQQYINGQPTDTYTKGERVDDVDYSTYETCMGGSGNSRWVSIPQTVCYNGDLWSMEKEQISYDGGVTWVDTTNTRRDSVIEPSASQCSGADNDWRVVYGEYICNGTTKCLKEAEYIDNSPTGRTRAGSMVELLSEDCGVMYQWVNVPNEYVCVYKCGRGDKYTKQKQQYSLDNGVHWEDTGETREGDFVEKNSSYCGCDTSVTRWVNVPGEYVCVGTSKYTKEKEQSSTDGTNWTDTGNTRAGSLIAYNSEDCGGDNPDLILDGLIFSNQGDFGADTPSKYMQKTSVSVPDKLLVFDNPSDVSAYASTDPYPNSGNEGQPGYTNLISVSSTDSLFKYQGIGCKKNGKYSVFGVSIDNIINTVTFNYSSISEVPECPYDLQIDYNVWPTSTGSWPSGWGGVLWNTVFKSGGENYSAWVTETVGTTMFPRRTVNGAVVIHNFSKSGVFFSLPNLSNPNTFSINHVQMRKTNSTHNFAVLGMEPVGTSLTYYGYLMVFDMDEYKVYRTPRLTYSQYHNNFND